jgi:hypothetical protein
MHFLDQGQSAHAQQLDCQRQWPANPTPLKPFVKPANKNSHKKLSLYNSIDIPGNSHQENKEHTLYAFKLIYASMIPVCGSEGMHLCK